MSNVGTSANGCMSGKGSSNLPPPEERFHTNTVKMTSLIRRIVVEANKAGYNDVTPFVVDLAAKYLRENFDKKDLIEGFIKSSHPPIDPHHPEYGLDHSLWDKIFSKDEVFFREKAFDIFKTLPVDAIEAFKKLSTYVHPETKESIIKVGDKKEIIDYFHAFVKISIKYIHAMRQPYVVEDNGKRKLFYKNPNSFKGIDVLNHAKKWGLQLEFTRE